MRTTFVALVCLMAYNFCLHAEADEKKQKSIVRVLSVIERMRKLATANSIRGAKNGSLEKTLKALLEPIRAPEELAKIGIICRILAYPGDAGDVRFDGVFDQAFWMAAERLSAMEGEDASAALDEIERKSDLQAGDRRAFHDLLEARDRKTASDKKNRSKRVTH